MYEQLIYVSRAATGLDAKAAYDIIRVAHNRNSRDQLTGMLVFLDGYFLQVLEGRPHHLEACFERISADSRHTAIELRRRTPSAVLEFAGEWMALRHESGISDTTKLAFNYQAGYPKDTFDADKLLAFAHACKGDLYGDVYGDL